MIASGQRSVNRLLAKVDRLGHIPKETERFRAAIDEANKKHKALERFIKYVTYYCAWLELADGRLEAVCTNRAPKQHPTGRPNDSGYTKLEEVSMQLIKLRNKRLAKNS